MPQRTQCCISPPPVAPKPRIKKTQDETGNIYVAIEKSACQELDKKPQNSKPPPLPSKKRQESLDDVDKPKSACQEVDKKPHESKPPPLPSKKRQESLGDVDEPMEVDKKPQKSKLPTLSSKKRQESLGDVDEPMCGESWSDFEKQLKSWTDLQRDIKLRGLSGEDEIIAKANHLYKALWIYNLLLTKHGGNLKQLIGEMFCIADNLDKTSKGTKIAGITGGATAVAGGVAAAAGVILSPFTLGASLALTAVGVGVAAAGGVTGASAAIAHKATLTNDKKKIDKTLKDFSSNYEEILGCLKFVNKGIEELRGHGLSNLTNLTLESTKAAKAVKVATENASSMAADISINALGVMSGFAIGMDMYFQQGKDGPKVKKGLESKLAMKIRALAEELDKGLNQLVSIRGLIALT
ncbi:apolipoprotein L6-like isoform 2-T2 [Menidia menidia]